MSAPVPLVLAGPGDLDALLPLLERFSASQGMAFDATRAQAALGALLARPELGRVYRIVRAALTVGYVALTFGWSLEWGGRGGLLWQRPAAAEPAVKLTSDPCRWGPSCRSPSTTAGAETTCLRPPVWRPRSSRTSE